MRRINALGARPIGVARAHTRIAGRLSLFPTVARSAAPRVQEFAQRALAPGLRQCDAHGPHDDPNLLPLEMGALVARSATVIAPTAWARLAARRAVSIASGNTPAVVVATHERLIGLALGVALLGFATSLIALVVVLLWLCR